jgi:hypothetical protein
VLCFASGCLFVHHTTRIVRDKEPVRPVRFESEQAKQFFLGGVHELQAHKDKSNMEITAVPFVCWNSSESALSDNAIYNDQISACDTNGDNLITLQEALVYRAVVAERVRAMEMKNSSSSSSTETKSDSPGTATSVDLGAHSSPDSSPPALIHLSTQSSAP